MTPPVSTSRSNQTERFPTAPKGTVTQPSHKYVNNRTLRWNGTSTLNSGEADQS